MKRIGRWLQSVGVELHKKRTWPDKLIKASWRELGGVWVLLLCGLAIWGSDPVWEQISEFMRRTGEGNEPSKDIPNHVIIRNLGLAVTAIVGLGFACWRNINATRQTKTDRERLDHDKQIARHERKKDEQRFITDQFYRAIEQIGSDSETMRIGALYTLWRLAEEVDDQNIKYSVLDTVCAFIRSYCNNQKVRTAIPEDIHVALSLLGNHTERIKFKNDYFKLNLQNVFLPGVVLAGAYLRNADFTNANLEEANLESANLRGSKLVNANLTGASLVGADLFAANLTEAILNKADFSHAELTYAALRGAKLQRATFTEANLTEARLQNVKADNAIFYDSTLTGVDFQSAILLDAIMDNANLEHAEFYGAHLEGSSFREANLKNVKFNGASLSKANFESAKNLDINAFNSIAILKEQIINLPEGVIIPQKKIGY